MSGDVVPAQAEPPISEEARQRGIDVLQGLVAGGKVELDHFKEALNELLRVQSESEFAALIRRLAAPVDLTPPSRRRAEPLKISSPMGEVRLEGHWQVGRLTTIHAGMGTVTIDLTEAEFDDWDVDIVVHATMGSITLIVPKGFDVRLKGRNGSVKSLIEPPTPGFPVVWLSATADMGTIRIIHERTPKVPRARWRGRRRKQLET